MLGEGRPFILEFYNPKKIISIDKKVESFLGLMKSDLVKAIDFKLVDKNFFDELKKIENSKAKSY